MMILIYKHTAILNPKMDACFVFIQLDHLEDSGLWSVC